MPQSTDDDNSTLVQVMSSCRQANIDPDVCCHMVALGLSELKILIDSFTHNVVIFGISLRLAPVINHMIIWLPKCLWSDHETYGKLICEKRNQITKRIIYIYHYDDVIMTMLASQITSLPVVCSIVYSGVNQRKHQSSASLAFVREIHRGPVNFPHKWPVTRKMFPFDDVIMICMRQWIRSALVQIMACRLFDAWQAII